jgi:hypothetical protein
MGFIDVTATENQRLPANQPQFELFLLSSESIVMARKDCTDPECDRCLVVLQRRVSNGSGQLLAWRAPEPLIAKRFATLLAKAVAPAKDGLDPFEFVPYQLRRMAHEGELVSMEAILALKAALQVRNA